MNNSSSCRIKPAIVCGLFLVVLAAAANAQFKPYDEKEVAGSVVTGEPIENFKPLRIFEMPSATFPDEVRAKGTSGTVSLQVRFLAGGTIGKIIVIQGLPDGLNEEAVKAARAIRFLPARLNGRLVNSAEIVKYHFPEAGRCTTGKEPVSQKRDPHS
jgi:TonB family protein